MSVTCRWCCSRQVQTKIRKETGSHMPFARVGSYEDWADDPKYSSYGPRRVIMKPLKRITINVGGQIFKIEESLLKECHNPIFYKLLNGAEDVPCGIKLGVRHYFFDRNPDVFYYIIKFYKSGFLHIPLQICGNVVRLELKFWRIRDIWAEPCCWTPFNLNIQESQQMGRFLKHVSHCDFHPDFQQQVGNEIYKKFIFKLQLMFTTKETSLSSKVYITVSCFVTLMYVITSSVMINPSLRVPTITTSLSFQSGGNSTSWELLVMTKPTIRLLGLSLFFDIFFITDQCLRYIASKNRRKFFMFALNLIDLLCNVMEIILHAILFGIGKIPPTMELVSYFFRSLRVFRLVRHNHGLMVLYLTVAIRIRDFGVLFSILMVVIIMFGLFVFITESYGSQQPAFTSLPEAFYFSTVTVTNVGYGDRAPITFLSRVVTAVAAAFSLLTVALTVPVLSYTFCSFYELMKFKITERLSPMQALMMKTK